MTMTFSPAGETVEVHDGPVCPVCDGPSWQWRGSVHGYTCGPCIARYLADAAARADAADRRTRERLTRKLYTPKPSLRFR